MSPPAMHQTEEPAFTCPSAGCVMCAGEACSACGAGYIDGAPFCDHDCIDRHSNAVDAEPYFDLGDLDERVGYGGF